MEGMRVVFAVCSVTHQAHVDCCMARAATPSRTLCVARAHLLQRMQFAASFPCSGPGGVHGRCCRHSIEGIPPARPAFSPPSVQARVSAFARAELRLHCCCCCVCWCVVLQVSVHYPNGRQQLVTYRQAFTGGLHTGTAAPVQQIMMHNTPTAACTCLPCECPQPSRAHVYHPAPNPPCTAGGGEEGAPLVRHCINCFKAVEGAVAPEDAVLQGALDLFCSLECERSWSIKSSSGGEAGGRSNSCATRAAMYCM